MIRAAADISRKHSRDQSRRMEDYGRPAVAAVQRCASTSRRVLGH
jgi:hypothetical protein